MVGWLGCGWRLFGRLCAFCGGGGLLGGGSVGAVGIFASKENGCEKKQSEGGGVGWLVEAGHRCLFAPVALFENLSWGYQSNGSYRSVVCTQTTFCASVVQVWRGEIGILYLRGCGLRATKEGLK